MQLASNTTLQRCMSSIRRHSCDASFECVFPCLVQSLLPRPMSLLCTQHVLIEPARCRTTRSDECSECISHFCYTVPLHTCDYNYHLRFHLIRCTRIIDDHYCMPCKCGGKYCVCVLLQVCTYTLYLVKYSSIIMCP